jgi:SPP1 gp7 family putative phage head morphogenesis protein
MNQAATYGSLPFDEAIDFLRQKVPMPSKRWEDFTGGMHAKAFVVAGATKDELVKDLFGAVQKGLTDGTGIGPFRKEFDQIVAKHGWQYKGNRAWRTNTIFNTNLSTAYAAGREKQMTDPDVLKGMPYWRYRTMDDSRVRALHRSWNNTVLPANDPWWDTHTPPNGWNCRCFKEPVTQSFYNEIKDSTAFTTTRPDDGMRPWINPSTGETEMIPNGIDPGFQNNPGRSAWGRDISKNMAGREEKPDWEDIAPLNAEHYGLAKEIPADKPQASRGTIVNEESGQRAALRRAIGGDEAFFTSPHGEVIMVNQGVVDHNLEKPGARKDRSEWFPFIRETIENPAEIWATFQRDRISGEFRIAQRFIKVLDLEKNRPMLLMATTEKGAWAAMTVHPRKDRDLKNIRKGRLIWSRK